MVCRLQRMGRTERPRRYSHERQGGALIHHWTVKTQRKLTRKSTPSEAYPGRDNATPPSTIRDVHSKWNIHPTGRSYTMSDHHCCK